MGRTGCRRTRRMRANQIYNEADPIRSRRHCCRKDKDTATSGRGKRKSEKKSTCCRPQAPPRPPPPAPGSQRLHVRPDDPATSRPPGRRSARSIFRRSSNRGADAGGCWRDAGGPAAVCLRLNVDRARGRAGSLEDAKLTPHTTPRCLDATVCDAPASGSRLNRSSPLTNT